MLKTISVLVTGVGGGGLGEQVLKALKLAGIYRIIATDVLSTSMGFHDANIHYVTPLASDENYIQRILEICKEEDVQILIPGSEQELKKISDNRKSFKEQGVLLLINDAKVINLCMDKWQTNEFFRKNDIKRPFSYNIESEEQLEDIERFPLVIKPVRGGRGSSNVFIAQDKEELQFFVKYIKKQGMIPLVQEYVGSPYQEYTVGVLTDFKGKLLDSIVLKRQILSGLSSKTKVKNYHQDKIEGDILVLSSGISQGVIDDYPEISQCAENIALKLGSRGPLNIQCRKTKQGIYIFEINPRFSGTTSIRALAGFNEVDILIRQEFLKEEIKLPIRIKKGIVMRGVIERYA